MEEKTLTERLIEIQTHQKVLEDRLINIEQMLLEMLEKSSDEENEGWQ